MKKLKNVLVVILIVAVIMLSIATTPTSTTKIEFTPPTISQEHQMIILDAINE